MIQIRIYFLIRLALSDWNAQCFHNKLLISTRKNLMHGHVTICITNPWVSKYWYGCINLHLNNHAFIESQWWKYETSFPINEMWQVCKHWHWCVNYSHFAVMEQRMCECQADTISFIMYGGFMAGCEGIWKENRRGVAYVCLSESNAE